MPTFTPQFIVTCEQAFLSAGTNNLNIIGIFSQINAEKFPFAYPRFALVVNFDTDSPGQHILKTDIIDPNGKEVAHTELPVAVTAGNMQVIANFENMHFLIPGQYAINVLLDGEQLGHRNIQVRPVIGHTVDKANIA